jgi:hypothetical protein
MGQEDYYYKLTLALKVYLEARFGNKKKHSVKTLGKTTREIMQEMESFPVVQIDKVLLLELLQKVDFYKYSATTDSADNKAQISEQLCLLVQSWDHMLNISFSNPRKAFEELLSRLNPVNFRSVLFWALKNYLEHKFELFLKAKDLQDILVNRDYFFVLQPFEKEKQRLIEILGSKSEDKSTECGEIFRNILNFWEKQEKNYFTSIPTKQRSSLNERLP